MQLVVFRYSPTFPPNAAHCSICRSGFYPSRRHARAHLPTDGRSRRPHCGISRQTAEYTTSCSLARSLPELPSDLLLGLPHSAVPPRRQRCRRRLRFAEEDYDDSL